VVVFSSPAVWQFGSIPHPVRANPPIPNDAAPPTIKPALRRKFLLETFFTSFLPFSGIAKPPLVGFNLRLLFPFYFADSHPIIYSCLAGTCDYISIALSPFPDSGIGFPHQSVPSLPHISSYIQPYNS
jgi:hypothetical protein